MELDGQQTQGFGVTMPEGWVVVAVSAATGARYPWLGVRL